MNPTSEPASSVPDLRVARVVDARDHPNADRLLLVRVDLGPDDRRQIVAGLVGHYDAEELDGKTIVVVANLKPATLRGEVSEGMLLAAEDEETGHLGVLLAPGAEPGTSLTPPSAGAPAAEITFEEFGEHELMAGPQGVRLNGALLEGAELRVDRGVSGRLR